MTSTDTNATTSDRLEGITDLSVRAADAPVDVNSDDYQFHKFISLTGEGAPEADEEIEQEPDEGAAYEAPPD